MSASRIAALMNERKGRRLAVASERALASLSALKKAGFTAWVVGSLARGTFSVHSDVDFLVDCDHEDESAAFRILEGEMGDFPFHFIPVSELDEAKKTIMMKEAVDASGICARAHKVD